MGRHGSHYNFCDIFMDNVFFEISNRENVILSSSKAEMCLIRLRKLNQAVLGMARVCSSQCERERYGNLDPGAPAFREPCSRTGLQRPVLAFWPQCLRAKPRAPGPDSLGLSPQLLSWRPSPGSWAQLSSPWEPWCPSYLRAFAKPSSLPKTPISVRSAPVSA